MTIEAMKQALEALEEFGNHDNTCPQWPTYTEPEKYPACDCGYDKALKSIDQAIAEAEKQEPCGWQYYQDGKWHNGMETNNHRANTEDSGIPVRDVYTHPQPKREWVGLTHEEIDYQAKKDDHGVYFALGALWAEAKLKAKNFA